MKFIHIGAELVRLTDSQREGTQDTPRRFSKFWDEYIIRGQKRPELTTFSSDIHNGEVHLTNLRLYSMCEHHILPFFGTGEIIYRPRHLMLGLSKFQRMVDWKASGLRTQERITNEVFTELLELLDPIDLSVSFRCRHLCAEMRGVQNSMETVTTKRMEAKQ